MGLPLPMTSLIEDCKIPGGLTILRAGQAVKNAFGEFVPAATSSILFNPIGAHNLTGKDLDELSEADRNSGAIRVYTIARIFVQDGGQAADLVQYQSRTWRCTQVLDYSLQGGIYISTFTLQDVQTPVP